MSAGGGGQGMGGGFDASGSAGLGADAFDGPGISAAELAALDAAMFDMDNMMAANPVPGKSYNAKDFMEQFGPLTHSTHNQKPWRGLTLDDVPNINPPGWGLGAAAAAAAAIAAATKGSSKSNPSINSVNPHAGFGVDDAPWGVNPKGMKVSSKELPASVVPSIEQMLDWNPLQFDTNFNTNITHPALTPEARQLDPNAANKVLDAMGIPWGVNAISNISHSDTVREYAERAAAERALYAQIAQQITQAAGQSGGGTTVAGPTGGSTGGGTTGGGNTGGGTTGGGSTGGGTTGGGTTCGGRKPKPPRGGKQDPPPRKADPIDILVKTILTPKKKMRQVWKSAQKSLRQGRKPDMTILSDYQQDLVRNILNPPKPAVSSNYSSIENR